MRSTLLSPRGQKDTCAGHQHPKSVRARVHPQLGPILPCPQVPAKCQSSPLAQQTEGPGARTFCERTLLARRHLRPPQDPPPLDSNQMQKGRLLPGAAFIPHPTLWEPLSGGRGRGTPRSTPYSPQGSIGLYCFLTKAPQSIPAIKVGSRERSSPQTRGEKPEVGDRRNEQRGKDSCALAEKGASDRPSRRGTRPPPRERPTNSFRQLSPSPLLQAPGQGRLP